MTVPMTPTRVAVLTLLALVGFAANSLLCRAALERTGIDAASFTALRLASGAVVLPLLALALHRGAGSGDWLSGALLFAYAACFSFAYESLGAATGALLLFGAVQATMIGRGLAAGERFASAQWLGFAVAIAGLVALVAPGLTAPPWRGATLMLAAGVAWGAYSLRGRRSTALRAGTARGDAIRTTAGNFLRSVPFALLLLVPWRESLVVDTPGVGYAAASGAIASGVGYCLWYLALPALRATTAATLQLAVPVLTAVGGVVLLGEVPSVRLVLASLAILGGISLVVARKRAPTA
jgi:drug/metabolite transporter (DMT)-like permease